MTGLGLADLEEEPAGLKRIRNAELPSEVTQTMSISWAALTEPEPHREDYSGSWSQIFTAKLGSMWLKQILPQRDHLSVTGKVKKKPGP